MMLPFLVFLALLVAFPIVCVYIAVRLRYRRSWTKYLQGRQLVTLSQEAFLERRSRRRRRGWFSMGMGDCMWRVSCISLAMVGLILFLIVVFISLVS